MTGRTDLGPRTRTAGSPAYKRFARQGKALKSAGFTPDDLSEIKGPPQGGGMRGSYAAVLRDRIIELRGEH